MTALLLSLVLAFLPAQSPPETVGGVVVYGELTNAEKQILVELEKRIVPLPDTIRVKYVERSYGYIEKGSNTITLSTDRHRSPRDSESRSAYLYGRRPGAPSIPIVGDYYTLTHEIAHFLQWRVLNGKSELPPPYWWTMDGIANPYRVQVETEADLMTAAIANIVFETPVNAFGYPKQIWAGSVESLTDEYKARILDFYRVTNP